MHRLAKEFVAYCERNFDFEGEEGKNVSKMHADVI